MRVQLLGTFTSDWLLLLDWALKPITAEGCAKGADPVCVCMYERFIWTGED